LFGQVPLTVLQDSDLYKFHFKVFNKISFWWSEFRQIFS